MSRIENDLYDPKKNANFTARDKPVLNTRSTKNRQTHIMYILNTTFHVDNRVRRDFLDWARKVYMPAAIDTGLFGSARLLRVLTDTDPEGVSFALQMDCESISEARRWHDETATLLRDDMFQRWGDKVLFFTTYLKDAE